MITKSKANYTELPQFLQDYFNYLETIKGKSRNTVTAYSYDLRLFFKFIKAYKQFSDSKIELSDMEKFNDIKISDIGEDFLLSISLSDLYAFLSFVSQQRTNSSCARARKVASLKSFFNYATNKAKLIQQNPAKELESPKIKKKLPRYLNIDESKKLLNSILPQDNKNSIRDYAIMTIFLNCGLRLSELVGINLDNIKNNSISVTGKGEKERIIFLNTACIDAINEYMKVRPVDGVKDKKALFLSERKQRISKNTVQYIVKKYIQQSGLDTQKYSAHKLRHTAATLMYKHGKVDVRALQKILGHETLATTQIYTHLDNQQLQDALNSNPLADFHPESKT